MTGHYIYDGNGNRRGEAVSGKTGTYQDQSRILMYGGATTSCRANGELRARLEKGQTTTYSCDVLGSLVGVECTSVHLVSDYPPLAVAGGPTHRGYTPPTTSASRGAQVPATVSVTRTNRAGILIQQGWQDLGCGVDADGVLCWSEALFGRDSPTARVVGVGALTKLAVGTTGACGLERAGTVACWGKFPPLVAHRVDGVTNATEVGCWSGLCCALEGSQNAVCWGLEGDTSALQYFWRMKGVRREGLLTYFQP